MEIKEQLILTNSGNKVVNAVMLRDEGEEYPVFLNSLLLPTYFEQLVASGYKLYKLPTGFVKDGVKIEDLPVRNYTASPEEYDQMYACVDREKVSNDTLKKYLDTSIAALQIPPTQYTITTREDFLSYLNTLATVTSDEDFKPINYFVSPGARFSFQEYFAPENMKYVDILNKRRTMSVIKFRKLLKFLQDMQLVPATPTAMSVIDAYHAWGVDGMSFNMLSITHNHSATRMTLSPQSMQYNNLEYTIGMLDGAGNLFVAPDEQGKNWLLPSDDPQYISKYTEGMDHNAMQVISLHTSMLQTTTSIEGDTCNIRYSVDDIFVDGVTGGMHNSLAQLRVVSPMNLAHYIPMYLAFPANDEKLKTRCVLEAMADFVIDARRPSWDVSTFKALSINGLSRQTALAYICSKSGAIKAQKDILAAAAAESRRSVEDADQKLPEIVYADVESFCQTGTTGDTIKDDFMWDIIHGNFNIDMTQKGMLADATQQSDEVFKALYALHYVMQISIEDIYAKIKTISKEVTSLTFEARNHYFVLQTAPICQSLNGWRMDVNNYTMERVRQCANISFVLRVAGEVCEGTPKRHVAMEFLNVNRARYKVVDTVFAEIKQAFQEKIAASIADERVRTQLLMRADGFAFRAFFEMYINNVITLPKRYFGEATLPINPEWKEVANKCIETKIETLEAYCAISANAFNKEGLRFLSYCVNAYVTPDFVIPSNPSLPIPMAPFYALWNNWPAENPAIASALVEKGVLPQGFVPWSVRFMSQQYKGRDVTEISSEDSLVYYYNQAIKAVNEWPKDKIFTAVPHPSEYCAPGLVEADDFESDDSCQPRDGAPVVRVGANAILKYEDFVHMLNPINQLPAPDTFVREFRGFSIEQMLYVPDIFSKMPTDRLAVMVHNTSGKLFLTDTMQLVDYSNIATLDMNKYAINHLYDRNYLVRGTDGRYWEVRV